MFSTNMGIVNTKITDERNMLIKIVRLRIVINLFVKIGTQNYVSILKLIKNANFALVASSNLLKNAPMIIKWRQQ